MMLFLTFLCMEWKYHARQRSTILLGVGFFLLISIAFPLSMGVDLATQKPIATGAIWIALLLANFLTMPQLLREDVEQGVLEQWRLKPLALEWVLCAKFMAVWATFAIPLLCAAPLAGLLLQWPWGGDGEGSGVLTLFLSLVIGSVALTALGMIGASFMARNAQGLLLILLVLPLSLPVMIFGVMASVSAQIMGNEMQILLGLCLLFLALFPVTSAAILREQIN